MVLKDKVINVIPVLNRLVNYVQLYRKINCSFCQYHFSRINATTYRSTGTP